MRCATIAATYGVAPDILDVRLTTRRGATNFSSIAMTSDMPLVAHLVTISYLIPVQPSML
jgi:hypothetical protein